MQRDLTSPSLERPSQTLLIRSPFSQASAPAVDNGLNESQHTKLGNGSAAHTVFINHSLNLLSGCCECDPLDSLTTAAINGCDLGT